MTSGSRSPESLPPRATDPPVTRFSPELVRAARTVLADLDRDGIVLGGAYDRALVAAAEGGRAQDRATAMLAIEAGRQATWQRTTPRRPRGGDAAPTVEIVTLCRFRAAGQEFEPAQHYRLTPLDFAELEWRAALEPTVQLYRPSPNQRDR